MIEKEEIRQLKLTEDAPARKAGKKEKQAKANKWMILVIFLITVVVSLIFYFSNPMKKQEKASGETGGADGTVLSRPKVYEF